MAESNDKSKAEQTEEAKKPTKRRWLRRVFVVVCLLVVLLIVLAALAPTLVSTDSGRRFVLGKVNNGITGSVAADSLTVRWGSGQSLTGVVVSDANGTRIARVGRIELPDASLWSILNGGLALGEIQIESVAGDIIGYDDGTTNLARALYSSAPSAKQPKPTAPPSGGTAVTWPSGLSLGVTLRDVDVVYRAAGASEPIRLVIPEAKLAALDPSHMVLNFSAELTQGGHAGRATADVRIDDLYNSSGVHQPDLATRRD